MPMKSDCPACGNEFTKSRKDQKYCCANCRKRSSKRKSRKEASDKGLRNYEAERANLERYDLLMKLTENLWTRPPEERLGYVKELIDYARLKEGGSCQSILTNRYYLVAGSDTLMRKLNYNNTKLYRANALLRTDTGQVQTVDDCSRHLLWRGLKCYPNIVQAAELYCQKFWEASVHDVVNGKAEEPETGEIKDREEIPEVTSFGTNQQNVASICNRETLVEQLRSKCANSTTPPRDEILQKTRSSSSA